MHIHCDPWKWINYNSNWCDNYNLSAVGKKWKHKLACKTIYCRWHRSMTMRVQFSFLHRGFLRTLFWFLTHLDCNIFYRKILDKIYKMHNSYSEQLFRMEQCVTQYVRGKLMLNKISLTIHEAIRELCKSVYFQE